MKHVNVLCQWLQGEFVHILRRHLQLILTKGEESTERHVRCGDKVLSRRKKLEIVSLLQDGAVVCGNVQAARVQIFSIPEGT